MRRGKGSNDIMYSEGMSFSSAAFHSWQELGLEIETCIYDKCYRKLSLVLTILRGIRLWG